MRTNKGASGYLAMKTAMTYDLDQKLNISNV